MATNLEQLLVRIDATTEGLRRELRNADRAVIDTQRNIQRSTDIMDRAFSGVANRLRRDIVGGLALTAGAMSLGKIKEYSDTWKVLEGRLRTVTNSQSEFNSVQDQLFAIAQRSRTSLEGVTTLYTRINQSVKESKKNQYDILRITETFGKALAITGESANTANGVITQFAQGVASDFKASSQEINSLIDGAPRLAQVIAKELGLEAPAQLKKLAEAGELSADKILKAIQRASAVIDAEAAKMPRTIGQALTELDNAFLRSLGLNSAIATGTNSIALGIHKLAENFDILANAASVAGIAIGARLVAPLVMMAAQQGIVLASTIRFSAALASVAGTSVIAASGTTALAAAMRLLKASIPIALAGIIYELVDGNESLIETQQGLNTVLETTRQKMESNLAMHGKLTETMIEEVKEQIKSLISQAEAQEKILAIELQRSELYLRLKGMKDFFAEPIVEGIAGKKYKSLQEQIDEQNALYKTINQMKADLAKAENYKPKTGKDDLTKEQQTKLKNQKEYKDQLLRTVDQEKELYETVQKSTEAYEKRKIEIDAENEAREKGYKIGTKEFEQIKAAIIQREEFTKKIDDTKDATAEAVKKAEEDQKRYADALAAPFNHAFENIQDEMARMLEKGKFSFDGLVSIAKKAAAEIATAMIIRPVIMQAAGSFGIGPDGKAATGGAGGFSGGSSGMSLPFSFLSSGEGASEIGASLNAGIDYVGYHGLGIGSTVAENYATLGVSGLGDAAANESIVGGLSGSFTPYSAVGGYLGNMGANALLGGDRGVGADIGGAVGGVAGAAFGASAAAAIGLTLGSFAGPIGALVGAFIGNAIGGLFGGGGRAHPAASAAITGFNGRGDIEGVSYKSKHIGTEQAEKMAQVVSQMVRGINLITGVNFDKIGGFHTGVDDGTGFFAFDNYTKGKNNGVSQVEFDPNDKDDLQRALGDLAKMFITRVDALGGDVSDVLIGAMGKIETKGRTLQDVLSDFAFITGFEHLGELPKVLTETEQVVAALRQEFKLAADTAERLGLSVEKVRKFEEKRMAELLKGFTSVMSKNILQIVAPGQLATIEENQRYAVQLKDLQTLGATQKEYQTANLLHQVMLQQIIEQNNQKQTGALTTEQKRLEIANQLSQRFATLTGSFKNILFEIQYGKYSADTPKENLNNMRDLVRSVGEKALGGDADAAEQLAELLPAFLELSGEVNGYNSEFAADRDIANNLAAATLSMAERQVLAQTQIAAAAQRQIEVLQSGFGALQTALEALGSKLTVQDIVDSATNMNRAWGANPDMNRELAAVTGYAGDFGSGGFAAFAAANPQLTNIINPIRAKYGFASGGRVSGVGGYDMNLARLTDDEFVFRESAARSIGYGNLHAMNMSGRMPGGDDSALVQRMDKLIGMVGGLSRVTAEAGNQTIDRLEKVADELNTLSRDAGLVNAL